MAKPPVTLSVLAPLTVTPPARVDAKELPELNVPLLRVRALFKVILFRDKVPPELTVTGPVPKKLTKPVASATWDTVPWLMTVPPV